MSVKELFIREMLEQDELTHLSSYAAKSLQTRGRKREEEPCEIRTQFQRDRDRILHSKAFRRLKHKTQVFFSPYDDHFRTRMTHTLEVSQIARTISKSLRLNEDLTEAIALGHDLGHTPFGHSGEGTLNRLMKEGFKHNEQSVRVAEVIEDLNLTQETLDGILNHTGKNIPFTLEGQIVKISDRIAYINHDIQDAIRAEIIKESDIPSDCLEYFSISNRQRMSKMVTDIVQNSYEKDKIMMSDECWFYLDKLRNWMFENVYFSQGAKSEEARAQGVLENLFNYYMEKLSYTYKSADELKLQRTVCDYVSGMTDRYVLIKFEENFLPAPFTRKNDDGFLYKLADMNGLKR